MTRYFASEPTELGLSVSAMVWLEGRLLLMQRSDNGHWGLPGGFVELGESVAQATRREVAEETGWQIELGRLIGVYSDPATQVVDYSLSWAADASLAAGASQTADVSFDPDGSVAAERPDRGRVQIVNLCFHAKAIEQGEASTPEETREIGFFATDSLPEPFVPIHRVRVEDGLEGRAEAAVR